MRSDRVWIPDSEVRCTPLSYCAEKNECGRYLAPASKGAPMGDYSRALGVLWFYCPHKLSTNLKPEKAQPVAKDWPDVS